MTDISGKIIEFRTKEGWTQQELADRLFVSRSLVSMWETGDRIPDLASVEKMAELFGTDEGEIVPGRQFVYFSADEFRLLEDEIGEICGSDGGPEKADGYWADIINSFLRKQNKKNRLVFTGRYLLMKTCRAIGEDVGISESSVRVRLARMRRSLRQYISEADENDG